MDSDDALLPVRRGDPRKIGPYRVVGRLGEGGMGLVYAATHAGTAAAVKLIRIDFAEKVPSRIILIDGRRLGELMVVYDCGVQEAQTVTYQED